MSVATQATSRHAIWEQQRPLLVAFGRALFGLIDSPEVSFHGRELRAADEGVGIQFQYRLVAAAEQFYFVVDVQLVQRGVGLAWHVEVMPVTQHGDADYRTGERQTFTLPLRDRDALRDLFRDVLTPAANDFFGTTIATDTRVSTT